MTEAYSQSRNYSRNTVDRRYNKYLDNSSRRSEYSEQDGGYYGGLPSNKGGKKYSLEEVFRVWFANEDTLNKCVNSGGSDSGLSFMNQSGPSFYHLDLVKEAGPALEDMKTNSLTDKVSNLSIGGTNISQSDDDQLAQSNAVYNMLSKDHSNSYNIFQGNPGPIPQDIEWFYIDPSGSEQGPFRSEMMQEWFNGGYLNFDLLIRTRNQLNYMKLKDLCDIVQDYSYPFTVSLDGYAQFSDSRGLQNQLNSTIYNPQAQSSVSNTINEPNNYLESVNFALNSPIGSDILGGDFINGNVDTYATSLNGTLNGSSQFGIDGINPVRGINSNIASSFQSINSVPTLLQNNIQTHPIVPRSTGAWGADQTSNLIGSSPQTPLSVNSISQVQMGQPAPLLPWASDVQTRSGVNSPYVDSSSLSVDNSLKNFNELLTNSSNSESNHELTQPYNAASTILEARTILSENKDITSIQEAKVMVETTPYPTDSKNQEDLKKEAKSEIKEALKSNVEDTPVLQNQSEIPVSKPTKKSVLAPWASIANSDTSTKTQPSLKEIQEMEADKLKEQRKIEESIMQAQEHDGSIHKEKTIRTKHLADSSPWAVNAVQKPVLKSLAEIQKEEAEAAKSRQVSGGSYLNNSTASTLASSLSSISKDDSWTKVSSKKSSTKKQTPNVISTSSYGSKTTPQMLRSVSASKPMSPVANAKVLKEDFLMWARVSMTNLYPTVSKEDLLEIFTSMPSNNDSMQIISETIYSSSATMDGRRFAQDFIKKRQHVEQQIGSNDDVSWSSAITSSAVKAPIVDEDGWSTTSKSKKKVKKI